jgi:hypothetical protein
MVDALTEGGHGRLGLMREVGCAWRIKLKTGGTPRSPCLNINLAYKWRDLGKRSRQAQPSIGGLCLSEPL